MGQKTRNIWINNGQYARKIVFMFRLITMVLCISIAINTGMAYHATSSKAAVPVTSHKQFVKKIYKIDLKRKSPSVFYCNGNGSKIFDGNLDALIQEVCAINKKLRMMQIIWRTVWHP